MEQNKIFKDVFFKNSEGKRRVIGKASNFEETRNIIDEFLKERNFKSYYTRVTYCDDEIRFDVGSHTEFFYAPAEFLPREEQ